MGGGTFRPGGGSLRPAHAHVKPERAAYSDLAGDFKLASHESHELPADGQPQPGAAGDTLAIVGLEERLEQLRHVLRGDPQAGVRHLDVQAQRSVWLRLGADPQGDRPAVGGELHRVAQQVNEHLAQLGFVGQEVTRHLALALDLEAQLLGLDAQAEHTLQIFQQAVQVKGSRVQRQPAGFNARHLQDVVDDAQQVFSAAQDGTHILWLTAAGALHVAQQQLGEAENGVHRRADFVGHVRQEPALGQVGGFGGGLGRVHRRFRLLPLRDVLEEADQDAAPHEGKLHADRNIERAPVLAPVARLELVVALGDDLRRALLDVLHRILRLQFRDAPGEQLRARVTAHPAIGIVDFLEPAREICYEEPFQGGRDDRRMFDLRLPALRDVMVQTAIAPQFARRIPDWHAVGFHRDQTAIFPAQDVFQHLDRLTAPHGRQSEWPHPLGFLRGHEVKGSPAQNLLRRVAQEVA